jgi:hypothetical protein
MRNFSTLFLNSLQIYKKGGECEIEELDKVREERPKIEANIKELKRLYLMFGILSGKLWFLEQIGLANPHADIPFPDLTMDSYLHHLKKTHIPK